MDPKDFAELLLGNGIYVFTVKQASAMLGKSPSYASRLLRKSAYFGRVERGRYFIASKNDVFVIASHILYPSYVTMRSAFRFYNITTQQPAAIDVAATGRHAVLESGGYRIVFRTVRKELMFGYCDVNGALVASPEKAFLDSLYLERSASLLGEEFDRALSIGRLDVRLLKDYAAKMRNRNLINILGIFLESRNIDASDLLPLRSHAYVTAKAGSGNRNARWRVVA